MTFPNALPHAFLVVTLFVSTAARADWVQNGNPVSTADASQHLPVVVSDGAGGVIMTWYDYRAGNADIYAQRISSLGQPVWGMDGVPICTNAAGQVNPVIVSDGAGGAVIGWDDYRTGFSDVYAQRVSPGGGIYWTANGTAVCTAFGHQDAVAIAPDASGGAIFTWQDFRSPTMDVYAQRLNGMGAPAWTPDGVALCTEDQWQEHPAIMSDGAGGAIVVWEDLRSFIDYDLYAQRVSSVGTPLWTPNGIVISTAGGAQKEPVLVADGFDGAIIAWSDTRADYSIYAQRVSSAGSAQWAGGGSPVCVEGSMQITPVIAADGTGGAIVAWRDFRADFTSDIYAQRMGANGSRQWTGSGVPVCTEPGDQTRARILADGAGGAVIAWDDFRFGAFDIYAQRVAGSGAMQWTPEGALVSDAASYQQSVSMALDGAGGVILAWNDARSETYDIYAQRIELEYGEWGHPEPLIASVADVANDQGGQVAVNWKRSDHDALPAPTITHYSVWRAVNVAEFSTATASIVAGAAAPLKNPADVALDFQGHAVWHERVATTDYYWEWVASQSAVHDVAYSVSAATRADAMDVDPALHYFRIVAHTANASVSYKSTVMSGASVDNLAPAAPILLLASRVGADVLLRWNRVRVPDLRDYAVYRATASGVTPVPVYFLASAADTVIIDPDAPATTLYYVVTAYDIHDNQSLASNEASVSAATGAGQTPAITALTLNQNFPNPFSGTTEFPLGLVAESTVSVEVFDVAGRRVASFAPRTLTAGWQRLTFDGRNERGTPLASGVYFYRVTARGETTTRKMVIGR